MANELMLINPRRRRRKTSVRRRRRNPARPAAVVRRTVARRTSARTGLTRSANPKRRISSYRRRPARRSMRRYRRNPVRAGRMTMRSIMNNTVMPAFQAGAGAIALDIIWGYVPVPLEWKTGNLRHVVKGGGAIVLGMLAQNFMGAQVGKNIALGALTVTFHAAMRDALAQFAPNIPLGYVSPAVNAGNYGGEQTYNYPGGDPMLQGDMGLYVGSPGPSIPKRETENMGYYT